jgi:hypothetical protein
LHLAADHTSGIVRGLGRAPSAGQLVSATVSGYHVAFLVAAVMLGSAGVLLAVLLRRRDLAALALDSSPVPAGAA